MKLRYLIVDARGQLRRVSKAAVDGLWAGGGRAADLGGPGGTELRLVSVVCDGRLRPKKLFLLRLPLTAGRFTVESRPTLRTSTATRSERGEIPAGLAT